MLLEQSGVCDVIDAEAHHRPAVPLEPNIFDLHELVLPVGSVTLRNVNLRLLPQSKEALVQTFER